MLLLPSSQICCVSNTQNRIIYFSKRSAAWAPLGQVALRMLPPWALFFHADREEQAACCLLR